MNAAELVVLMRAETTAFRRDMQSARTSVTGVEKGLTSMKGAALGALAGFATLSSAVRFVQAVARETTEAQLAAAKLGAVLRATGGSAGFTKDQLLEMGNAIAHSTLFDDAQMNEAIATLATFRSVSGDTFKDAIRLSTDLSSVFGGDLQQATVQLGKALENPVKGLTALSKAGVTYTAEQQKRIRQLVEENRLYEAQKIVLEGVRSNVGGVAQAMNTGLAGAVKDLNDSWGTLLENFGKTAERGGLVQRTVEGISQAMLGLVPDNELSVTQIRERLEYLGDAMERFHQRGITKFIPGVKAIHDATVKEFNRLAAMLMSSTVTATPEPPKRGKVVDEDAEAEAKRRAEAIRRMAESIRVARIEMLEGADAAEIYRARLAGMPPHIIEMIKVNQAYRKELEAVADQAREQAEAADQVQRESAERRRLAMEKEAEDYDRTVGRIRERFERIGEEEKQAAEQARDRIGIISSGFEAGFEGALTRQIRNFRDFAETIASIWQRSVAKMVAEHGARLLASGLSSLAGSLLGAAFPGQFGNGPRNNFINDVPVTPGVNVAGGGGGVTIVNNWNISAIDSRSFAETLQRNGSAIAGTLVDQMRSNHALDRFMRGGR